ncbi:hypothetical protein SAMN04488490_1855 [Marinobacter sp. LV10R510-11A]|uniref:hypothetical protein n=1 Tax=Marinobacter sp. LV10R510-11A TaxID=1415568 RepID=UPI000BB730D3|nr:hypothetical protein [Marinobacter sp. LV10R510-11A]SOB76177.1 hypothetical protein SAMN04488490_1855 [Marinobacter sp. LV10R510-11A]
MRIYYRENSRVIELPELKDQDGNVIAGATVEATLTLEDGTAAPGVTNPVILSPSGAGRYIGMVPPIDLPDGTHIIVEVVSVYSGIKATSRETMVVKDRSFNKVSQ